uniref:Uncharacterized protein n=1 Tax=Rhizophora mucronata TaxID=61149 RepID=A0A2P2QRI9_RHIMU
MQSPGSFQQFFPWTTSCSLR